ncbi:MULTISPECIES: zeta toxin family protein [Sphingobacterium]|uniref:zeta toxin family protein n=1 Tax=Sphingobacterium TaxID=28453 RepID=UPI001053CCAF|nr:MULTISPECIES: zeta toxin family protein [Sphingobacterium]MCW2259614.1 dephospho-CoA kinase [Sphingobacterium kitahiroshimense]TCR13943.1 zeta toxin [Sphingobacterium sp. JUb78]
MANKTSRPLNNFELVEHFLQNALSINIEDDKMYEIVCQVVSTELNIENFDESLISLNSKSYRINKYRKDSQRLLLQKRIVAELLIETRLENDEDIVLGKGGAFPLKPVKTDRNAFIVIGLPASGKSGISNIIADEYGAIILDSDYAKRKLPEFSALPFGATLVHEESDKIIFSSNNKDSFKSLFEHCIETGANIVLPKIGSNLTGIITLIEILKKSNYFVHLTLVELDRVKASQRALTRFNESRRYVPLGLIFDTYANNPTTTFYKIITYNNSDLESYGCISTDVKKDEKPKKVLLYGNNPAKLFK